MPTGIRVMVFVGFDSNALRYSRRSSIKRLAKPLVIVTSYRILIHNQLAEWLAKDYTSRNPPANSRDHDRRKYDV